MMNEGVQRMDELFAQALAAGRLDPDPTLITPPPPPPPEELEEIETLAPATVYQVQLFIRDSASLGASVAQIRGIGGVESVSERSVAVGAWGLLFVTYRGDTSALARSADGARMVGRVYWPHVAHHSLVGPAATARASAGIAAMTRADQIALPLDWPQGDDSSRFIVSDANRDAFEHFRKWSMWPVRATLLTGPAPLGALIARARIRRACRRAPVRWRRQA